MLSQGARRLLWIAAPLLSGLVSAGELAPPTAAELQKLIGVRWYGTYLGAVKCGFARERLEQVEKNGQVCYVLQSDILMKIRAMGAQQKMTIRCEQTFSETGNLISVESKIGSPSGSQVWEGAVEGDRMKLVTQVAGRETTTTVPAPKTTLTDMLGASLLAMRHAEPGTQTGASIYEPFSGKELQAVTEVGQSKQIVFNGVPTDVVEVITRFPESGMVAASWVDRDGQGVEMTQSLGMIQVIMRLEDEQQARNITYGQDIIDASVVPADKAIPDSTQVANLKLRLKNLTNDKVVISSGRMQYEKTGDGEYVVTCTAEKVDAGAAPDRPVEAPEMKKYLDPEELVQSDAPEIVDLAKEIVGVEENSWTAACRINEWVHANLAKKGTAAFSNALETLRTREGDCTEHSVLAVALCRAAGIPARQTSGLVYWPKVQGFAGHQWTEVWVGQWVAMDPAFGQDIADATHLKFGEGSLREAILTYAFFSNVKIEVLDWQ